MSTGELHGTRKGLAALGQSAAETARESIEDAVEHGREQVTHYYDRAANAAREWQHRGVEQYQRVRGQVQRHAITSTLIAFAAGFLISRFLFRR